jgi:hypothetical protein
MGLLLALLVCLLLGLPLLLLDLQPRLLLGLFLRLLSGGSLITIGRAISGVLRGLSGLTF